MNYSYKKFLAKAKEVLKDTLVESEKILNSIGMTMEFDASFPWTGEFKEAVGRCGIYSENADFAISIHFRAIYQAILEDMFDAVDTEYEWDRQIIDGIEGTVFHEIAHGILHKIMNYYEDVEEFRDWCIEQGFDKTIFRDEDDEEDLCEEYCRYKDDSKLGKFIKTYALWDGKE